MRFLLPITLFLSLALVLTSSPAQDEPLAVPKHNPQAHAKWALDFLKSAEQHRQFRSDYCPSIRFISWLGIPAEKLDAFKRVFNVWINQMSWERAVSIPRDVPGTDGRVQWFDINWYRWSPGAWQAVAERDRTFREPWVDCRMGQALRDMIHCKPKNITVVHGYELIPLVAIVWAPQLFRDTIETDRQPSYYDLLFARQRFGTYSKESKIESSIINLAQATAPAAGLGRTARIQFNVPDDAVVLIDGDRTKTHTVETPDLEGDGAYPVTIRSGSKEASGQVNVKPGHVTTVTLQEKQGQISYKQVGFVDKDFPRTDKEWDQAFGIDVAQLFQGQQDLILENGAIIEGGRDNPRGGSIVALNNRLVVDEPGPLHAMRTFDVFKTSGDKDYLENAPKLPALFRKKKVAFDAGELLSYLPNGGQAGFLIDGAGKRAEIAAGKIADGRGGSPQRLSPGVRNPGDCVVCHGGTGGYIVPDNMIKRVVESGIDFKFKDPLDEVRFRGFYLAWEKRIKAQQQPYYDLVAEATKEPLPTTAEWEAARADPAKLKALLERAEKVKAAKGWTSAEWVKHFVEFREFFDGPQSTKTLAAELGVPVEMMKRMAANPVFKRADGKIPVRNTVRLSALVQDLPTPRTVFDEDLFPVLGLLLYEQREGIKR